MREEGCNLNIQTAAAANSAGGITEAALPTSLGSRAGARGDDRVGRLVERVASRVVIQAGVYMLQGAVHQICFAA